MAIKLQFKRDTAANWFMKNPLLAPGEPGFELNTGKLKIGDGNRNWNDLPYTTPETSPFLETIDLTDLSDGSILIYSNSDNKWKSGTTLDQQNLDGGHY